MCSDSNNVACGHLTVPVNPAEPAQGVITLAMRRHRAPIGEAREAVIALAGGPGQSAIPFVGAFAQLLGPIVATRDLIAFDQRGTGFSKPLACAAFEHIRHGISPPAVALCGNEIGATRRFYTTAQTVADIEAIREAGGYEKLVLYGTSYGTKVAERYAQEYPAHVQALVLDSVVPPDGPEPFDQSTFAAVPRILRQLCSAHACARITRNPVADLARLVRHMRRGPVRGRAIDGHGRPVPKRVSSDDLVGILLQGDFDPLLRAEFPAAVRASDRGDKAPLARLIAHAEGGGESEEPPGEGFDAPLYFSTVCEETAFPWSRSAGASTRMREARAALSAIGASAFAPFTSANALSLSDAPACSGWPYAPGSAPEASSLPLPDVPALILSGADDLRTPTSGAQRVQAQIPDANLLVVPNTGHSVLGSDPTPCAHNALKAFFEGHPVRQCRERTPPPFLLPTPLPPHSIGEVSPSRGNRGLPGRTLHATLLTLGDFDRQLLLALLENLGEALFGSGTVRTGGLRAGWGGLVHGKFELHGYSYVPGVAVSGTIEPMGGGTLRIGGHAAARGTLHLGAHGTIGGVLGGARVHIQSPSPAEVGFGFEPGPASTRLSWLLAHPTLAALLHDRGVAALLRYVLGAR